MDNKIEEAEEQMVGELGTEIEDNEPSDEAEKSNENHSKKDVDLELFRMVFDAAQKPDEKNIKRQNKLTIVLTIALCIQLAWALFIITYIILNHLSLSTQMVTFVSLLVTAILAEIVAMAFVVVRFVFRTPLDTMLELLKDIIDKR